MRTLDMTTRSEGYSETSLIVIRRYKIRILLKFQMLKQRSFCPQANPRNCFYLSKSLLQLSRIAFDLRKIIVFDLRKIIRIKIRLRNGSQPFFFSPVHVTPELNLSLTLKIKLTL